MASMREKRMLRVQQVGDDRRKMVELLIENFKKLDESMKLVGISVEDGDLVLTGSFFVKKSVGGAYYRFYVDDHGNTKSEMAYRIVLNTVHAGP